MICTRCGTSTVPGAPCMVCGAPATEAVPPESPLARTAPAPTAPGPSANADPVPPVPGSSAPGAPFPFPLRPPVTKAMAADDVMGPHPGLIGVMAGVAVLTLVALHLVGAALLSDERWNFDESVLWTVLRATDVIWLAATVLLIAVGGAVAGLGRDPRIGWSAAVLAATSTMVLWWVPKVALWLFGSPDHLAPIRLGQPSYNDSPPLDHTTATAWVVFCVATLAIGLLHGLVGLVISGRARAIGLGLAVATFTGGLAVVGASLVHREASEEIEQVGRVITAAYHLALAAGTSYDRSDGWVILGLGLAGGVLGSLLLVLVRPSPASRWPAPVPATTFAAMPGTMPGAVPVDGAPAAGPPSGPGATPPGAAAPAAPPTLRVKMGRNPDKPPG